MLTALAIIGLISGVGCWIKRRLEKKKQREDECELARLKDEEEVERQNIA